MCLALCLPSSSAMLMLAGSEIFLRRGEGNARLSIPGVFDIFLFHAGVWSISHGRMFKETEKYNEIFPTKVELDFCSVFTQASYQKCHQQEDWIPSLWGIKQQS